MEHTIGRAATPGDEVDPTLHWLALSPREREVLTLLAAGHNCHEIGQQLYLSRETIRTHAKNARQKIGARTIAHGVALAIRHNLI